MARGLGREEVHRAVSGRVPGSEEGEDEAAAHV